MMKKATAPLKKSNNIKTKSAPTPVVSRVKAIATGLVKAMSNKPAKKPQVKTPPKKEEPKAILKKGAPHPSSVLKAKAPLDKPGKPSKEIHLDNKPSYKKANPVQAPVAPAHTKSPALHKVKAEPKSKAPRMTAAQLAEHLEKMCRETGCENQATTKGYCRLDYIKNWKKIKRKEMILKEGKLNNYIEELVSKYPDKYIDVIRQDLTTEVNFNKVIHDLELDESIDDLDYDGDSIDALIGGIKKEGEGFDDDEF